MHIDTYNNLRKIARGTSAAVARERAYWRDPYRTPSSGTPLRTDIKDPMARMQAVSDAAQRISDDPRYAREFSALNSKTLRFLSKGGLYPQRFESYRGVGWGPKYNKKATYMCMPFVSECFSAAHGGKPLWDKKTNRPALTQDINKALANNTELPIDTDNFNAFILHESDTGEPFNGIFGHSLAQRLNPRYPAAVLPGMVKIHRSFEDYGDGWGGHAGVTHGKGGTYQASSRQGVYNTPYMYWGFNGPDMDKAFTVMGKDLDPVDVARSMYDRVANSNPYIHFNPMSGELTAIKPVDEFIKEFKAINTIRNPKTGHLLPGFYTTRRRKK
jgi:hypothetical protein